MAQAIPYLIAGGTIMSSVGQLQAGSAQNRMMRDQAKMAEASANREAQVLEIKANEDQAVSQRRAQEARRQSRIQQSRALAVAASSGAGAVDPTVINTIGNLAGEGELAASNELYQGDDAASWKRYQAAATRVQGANQASALRVQGKVAKQSSRVAALGTLVQGGASMYTMFGKTGAGAGTPAPVREGAMTPVGGDMAGNGKKWWMQ